MPIQFHNTLTKSKQVFEPLTPGKVSMYHCGPTVYNFAHIGNFRAYVFADLLRRYLEYRGYEVRQVMNITDVGHLTDDADEGEDKMLVAAGREGKNPWEIAAFYAQAFFEDIDRLGILRAHVYPRATEHVKQMIALTQRLIDKGYAYVSNNCVYYDVTRFQAYGRLSGNTLDALQAGARIAVNPDKRNPADFALWVTDERHLMKWDSPWGTGYPGWHIECSAMAMAYLGETLDIHTGGEDNTFPHHECEIAQSEGATGQPYVRCWMHVRHLLVGGRKMAKSAGNFYTLRDLVEKGYDPAAIRYSLINTHYRQQLNFTLEGIDAAKQAIGRLRDFNRSLREASAAQDSPEAPALLSRMVEAFDAAMDDDLNISLGLSAVFEFVREVNRLSLSAADAAKIQAAIRRLDGILGVLGRDDVMLDEEIERLIGEREQARKSRNFPRADAIREQLRNRGILLEDTPRGVRWKRA